MQHVGRLRHKLCSYKLTQKCLMIFFVIFVHKFFVVRSRGTTVLEDLMFFLLYDIFAQ